MKQLSSFMVLSINGGYRISYTYDIIDPETGDLLDTNKKESFFVTTKEVSDAIESIQDYIRQNKLSD